MNFGQLPSCVVAMEGRSSPTVIISDMTAPVCGSSQTHLGTSIPSGGQSHHQRSDPQKNLRASVIFASDIEMISQRDFPLATFLQALDLDRMKMNFDDWPMRITRFDVNFVECTIKIYAAEI